MIRITGILLLLFVAGCASVPKPGSLTPAAKSAPPATLSSSKKGGGYYLDDGPDAHPPDNLDSVPDAVPKIEPLKANANRPYVALGKTYIPATENGPYEETGLASWYGRRFNGKNTSSGEKYDMYAMTAAHPTLPIPSYAKVTSLASGKSVIVRINDRGPFHSRRIIDLSYTAAHKLGIVQGGSGMVKVSAITPAEISAGRDLDANSTGIFLQLGSFSRRENAEKLLADAATKLDKGSAALVILNQSERYRVALGPYTDESSANEASREIRSRMNLTPIRIVRN
ncbi:MAG: septal ring lytic transglycosylase RlpA family protein [Burkholderiales bacterium]